MEVVDALAVLGLAPGCSWEEIRQRYRDQLMSHHPDAQGDDSSGQRTEEIVEAFRALRTITKDGALPLPLPFHLENDDPLAPMVLHARPGDVFVRMFQAAEQIGHVSYADREANLLQITIGAGPRARRVDDGAAEPTEWAPAQLTVELTAEGSLTMALFSLEALGVAEAPPIADVVGELAAQLRAPAAID